MKKSGVDLYGFLSYNERKSSMVLRFGYVKEGYHIHNSYEMIKTVTWSVIIYIPLLLMFNVKSLYICKIQSPMNMM